MPNKRCCQLFAFLICITLLLLSGPVFAKTNESKLDQSTEFQNSTSADLDDESALGDQPSKQLGVKKQYNGNEILVEVDSEDKAKKIARQYGAKVKDFNKHGFAVLRFTNNRSALEFYEKEANGFGDATAVSPNYAYAFDEVTDIENGLYNTNDILVGSQQQHALINDYSAWRRTRGSQDVVVAVIDSGIDVDHPEFTGRISPLSYNTCTDRVGIPHVDAINPHGTHVAGIIAAAQDNNFGGSGVAPNVIIMAIKTTDYNSMFTDDVIEGIYYAVDHGADIINISSGSDGDTNALEQAAIQYAIERGTLVVCSAGNSASNEPHYPAAYPESVAVAAADTRGNRAVYSNYGSYVDICAPGSNIVSTIPGGSFKSMSGTSMAAPVIAGVAALIKSIHPEYTVDQLKDCLYRYAIDKGQTGFDEYYGHGLVNAYAALIQDQSSVIEYGRTFPGEGTQLSPYQISTADQLVNMASLINMGYEGYEASFYELTADIDLSTCTSWTPIGTSITDSMNPLFSGTINGNGYHVSGMKILPTDISSTETQLTGFVTRNYGKIINLDFISSQITSRGAKAAYTGGIAAVNESVGVLDNCSFDGIINSTVGETGGLAGNNSGTIINCKNYGNISGGDTTGGIAGWCNTYSKIQYCSNMGQIFCVQNYSGGITGQSRGIIEYSSNHGLVSGSAIYQGGIAGYNGAAIRYCYNNGRLDGSTDGIGGLVGISAANPIRNSYNTGTVFGRGQYAGGLAGSITTGQLVNCYSTGDVSGSSLFAGGIAGMTSMDNQISQCYYTNTIPRGVGIGQDSASGRTAAQMHDQATYLGFSFTDVWQMPIDTDYTPVLNGNFAQQQSIGLVDQVLLIGEQRRIISRNPMNAAIAEMTWSFDPDLVSIDRNGFAEALSEGTTVISCISKQGGFSAQCTLTVRQGITSISLPMSMTIAVGETTIFEPGILPMNCHNRNLVWTSSNSLAAVVDQNGQLKALSSGKTLITAVAADGSEISASCEVTVIRRVTACQLNPKETKVSVGNQMQLIATILPLDASNHDVIWESSNTEVATIDSNGTLIGVSTGFVAITATTVEGGLSASCIITIVVPVTGIQISQTHVDAAVGSQFQLYASVLPGNAGIKDIIWLSFDRTYRDEILKVDGNGLVTCFRDGVGYVIAQSKDNGLYIYCTIVVGLGEYRISINGPDSLVYGQTAQYSISFMPADICGQSSTWSTFSSECASISSTGFLSTSKPGLVQIFVESVDPYGAPIYGTKDVDIRSIVKFDSRGGSTVASTQVSYTGYIKQPARPSKAGYTFIGWYKNQALTLIWDFNKDIVLQNTTLYAAWIQIPTQVKALATSYNTIQLSWSPTIDAAGYEVWRKMWSTGTYALVADQTTTTVTNAGLTAGKTYYYKVIAYKTVGGVKVYSSDSAVVTATPIPATPTGLKAVSTGYNSAKVTWTAVAGATGYEVYRKLWSTGALSLVSTQTATSFSNSGLATNKSYYYMVRAYRLVGTTKVYSKDSVFVSVTPVPSAPTGLKAVSGGSKTARVTWTAVSGASGYEVWRKMWSSGTYAIVSTQTANSLTNTGLAVNKTYYYKVRAYRMVGTTKVYGHDSAVVTYTPLS